MKKVIITILLIGVLCGLYFYFTKSKSNLVIEPAPPLIYKDLIQIDFPNKDVEYVSSPLIVKGKARGNWYFEASFPIEVLDEDGSPLGTGIAQAQGDWMTTEYVPFEGKVTFSKPKGKKGSIIFKKDNPSGEAKFDDSVSIAVSFK